MCYNSINNSTVQKTDMIDDPHRGFMAPFYQGTSGHRSAMRILFGGTMKKCRQCKEEKELSEFYPRVDSADGFNTSCKECAKEEVKKYSGKSELPYSTKRMRKILEDRGYPVQTGYYHGMPWVDLVVFGFIKIEVKFSNLLTGDKYHWSFTKTQREKEDCDFYIFIADAEEKERVFVIPGGSPLIAGKAALVLSTKRSGNGIEKRLAGYENNFSPIVDMVKKKIENY